ncbi:MAG: LacI family DNA-binding transcriptional regulator [Erythrobacter sp.]|nr:MAG: LacI family DNA-binding transcriptional regulator [Erythrobacter sp.]
MVAQAKPLPPARHSARTPAESRGLEKTVNTRKAKGRQSGQPTISDVAREAQCSPMTVSRVINNEASVRGSTRDAVLAAIEKLNYSPNRAARSLAGGEQLRIALLFDNPSSSYLAEFLMGSLEEANRNDTQLIVQGVNEEEGDDGKQLIGKLVEAGIRGFILPPPLCDDQSVLDLIVQNGGIVVAVGPGVASGTGAEVLIDDYQAAYDMTSHIIGLGHKRIGFIIGNPEQVAASRRLNGYRAAMENAGLETDDRLIVQGRFTYRSGMDAAERLLAVDPRPTAIFASNDDMAAATVAVAHRRHLDVPSDITVCGFDDTDLASSIWPELTTIRQPIREMTAWAVSTAARLLRAKKQGEKVVQETKFMPYQLIRRASDAAPSLVAEKRK